MGCPPQMAGSRTMRSWLFIRPFLDHAPIRRRSLRAPEQGDARPIFAPPCRPKLAVVSPHAPARLSAREHGDLRVGEVWLTRLVPVEPGEDIVLPGFVE